MIYNKSCHPVEVKKISIRLWSLRDEIEAAIGRRMKECEAAGIPLYIEDIKQFYNLNYNAGQEDSNVHQLRENKNEDGMTSLMESISEEDVPDPAQAEEAPAATKEEEESNTLNQAEEIIAEQTLQGLENKTINPILERPYQRQAPDLEKISYGFTLLSDINMEHFLSFTKDKFLQGQSVVVEFLIPQTFMMTAEVSYCHHFAMRSRIISSTKSDYRLQCKFSYYIPGERDNLRNFLKSVEPVIPEKKKGKKVSEDDSLGL
jgi:hypothetical protein